MAATFTPTDEQSAARDTFVAGHSFVLQAGAGTGKTSTLKLLAETEPERKGLSVAFNRAIAQEAQAKFPPNVTVKTIHALLPDVRFFGVRIALFASKGRCCVGRSDGVVDTPSASVRWRAPVDRRPPEACGELVRGWRCRSGRV